MKLADWITKENTTAAEFGRQIGTSRQNVARWMGGIIPRQDEMQAICEATKGAVTANDFFGITAHAPDGAARPAPTPAHVHEGDVG